jgi:predicted transcriptional regulator
MKTSTILSANEYVILALMWEENRPITRAEILKGTPNKNWNPASIHLILNSMLSKGVIKITDESVKYGRTYEPTLSYDEYLLTVLKTICPNKDERQLLNDCVRILKKLNK